MAREVFRERLPVVLELDVVAPAAAVGALRREELVVGRALELVGKRRLAGQAEEVAVELQPGDGDAGLRDVLPRVGQFVVGVEVLVVAARAGQVEAAGGDVGPRVAHGGEDLRIAGDAVDLEGAVEAGHHFVRLGVGDLVDALAGGEVGDEARPLRSVPGAEDHAAELEVARLVGEAVEPDHRLKHAAVGHADVRAALEDAALAGGVAEIMNQQVGHAPAGRQRRGVAGVADVGEQADQVVLVRPHVPRDPASLRQVGAEVAVLLLAGEQAGDDAVEFRPQRGIAGVGPGEGGGVEPLADVLAVPGLEARAAPVAGEQPVLVDREEAVGGVSRDALPEEALEVDLGRFGRHLPFSDLRRNRKRQGLRRGGGGHSQGHDDETSTGCHTHDD